jgi:hypothetical protein
MKAPEILHPSSTRSYMASAHEIVFAFSSVEGSAGVEIPADYE